MRTALISAAALAVGVMTVFPALSGDYMKDKAAVEVMLSGKTLKGVYLRTKSPYVLRFGADGGLVNQVGAKGKWWVNDKVQYCREWASGKLKGNKACMDLAPTPNGVAIYYRGKKVAEGGLTD